MDPAYCNRNIVDLSDAELVALGFLGEDVHPRVKEIVEKVKAHPELLGTVTCSNVDHVRHKYAVRRLAHPTENHDQDQDAHDSEAYIVVAPALISKYESKFWYHGISGKPPPLLWRPDLETNPFPTPQPGGRFSDINIPAKSIHGVFKHPLTAVWGTIAPRIIASLKQHDIKYSALQAVRFSSISTETETETRGPVVIWIGVRPGVEAAAARDATPDILRILAEVNVTDVVVEWYEAPSVVRLIDVPPSVDI